MTVQSRITRCGGCDQVLNEDPGTPVVERKPCPSCGSAARAFAITISETVQAHGKLLLKGRQAGRRKPFIEQTVGSDLHRRTGTWMHLERIIDRAQDWYHECVSNPKTSEVVHACDEPLSQHRGHGSARKR